MHVNDLGHYRAYSKIYVSVIKCIINVQAK